MKSQEVHALVGKRWSAGEDAPISSHEIVGLEDAEFFNPLRDCPLSLIGMVVCVSLAVNAISIMGANLWVTPDASYYVALAGGIADRGDFSNELFLVRPPGYPLFLASLFLLFGEQSGTAIQLIQHGMVMGCAIFATLIAWHLSERRSIALLTGLMTTFSFSLLTYANLITAETPYAFLVIASVYFLIRFHRSGSIRCLLTASLLAGVSAMIRTTGLTLVVVCLLVAWYRAWVDPSTFTSLQRWRAILHSTVTAMIPAMVVLAPMTINNRIVHGSDVASRSGNLALYIRTLEMDSLDSTKSQALNDIKGVVEKARVKGELSNKDQHHKRWETVALAYENVEGKSFSESAEVMGTAAKDVIWDNLSSFVFNTVRYSYGMMMAADSSYRFHPGGASGSVEPNGHCVRDPQAVILAANTYLPEMKEWITPFKHYLTISTDEKSMSSWWRERSRWYHDHIETGSTVPLLGSSPYETFSWLCIIGMMLSLLMRDRTRWMIIGLVVVSQMMGSALFGGPDPRYAVPVNPFLFMFAALTLFLTYHGGVAGIRWSITRIFHSGQFSRPFRV